MLYLSKGSLDSRPIGGLYRVFNRGTIYVLGHRMGRLWRSARAYPHVVPRGAEREVRRLEEAGLVTVTDEEDDIGRFYLLTNCIICPTETEPCLMLLPRRDRRILTWVKRAGLRLTVGELICLEDRNITPAEDLLGNEGRMNLVMALYTGHMSPDNTLEVMMEHSTARKATVDSIYRLMRLHYLLLV